MTSLGPRMPMYPPGAPGIGQQLFYGQAPPAMLPSQVRYSFHHYKSCFFSHYNEDLLDLHLFEDMFSKKGY